MLLYYNLFVHISSKNFASGFSFPKAVAKVVPFQQPTKLFPNLFSKKSLLAHYQIVTSFKLPQNCIVKHIFPSKRPSFLLISMGIRNHTKSVFFVKWRKCRKNRVKINNFGHSKNGSSKGSTHKQKVIFFELGTKKRLEDHSPSRQTKFNYEKKLPFSYISARCVNVSFRHRHCRRSRNRRLPRRHLSCPMPTREQPSIGMCQPSLTQVRPT